MSGGNRKTHVDDRHAPPGQVVERERRAPKHHLRVLQPYSLPSDWEIKPGVPKKLADCENGPRPCPYVSCRQHLWLALQQDQPGNPAAGAQGETTLRPIAASCTLDVSKRGGLTLEQVGEYIGVSATRVNQIEQSGLRKLEKLGITREHLVELARVTADERKAERAA